MYREKEQVVFTFFIRCCTTVLCTVVRQCVYVSACRMSVL